MDEKFRSSFIPKQPLVGQESGSPRYTKRRRESSSPFVGLSVLMFTLSLLVFGGVWGYTLFVEREIQDMEVRLEEQRQQFQPAEIAEYKRFDDRLKVAASILNNHIALSEIFSLLEEVTLPSVRYTTFDFSKDEIVSTEAEVDGVIVQTPASERLSIALGGEAGTFEDIALQAEEFKKNQFVRNSTFSTFQLNETGMIGFAIQATLDPSLIGYVSAINRAPEVTIEEGDEEVEVSADAGEAQVDEEAFQSEEDLNDGEN
ncbi:MAG: hypothetical protein WDZ74_00675 [Candidatus Paceibacterota bacterium]